MVLPSDPSSAIRTATPPSAYAGSGLHIRQVDTVPEFQACVALQQATWGETGDTVPASLLIAATHVGGLVLGAFGPDETLIGFVFSLAGADERGALHWSHMLAVRADARGAGIGRALKERQRGELARRGVERIAWTFDPLQARNAHLNINRLGARVRAYVADMYGITGSPLHLGMATDRLIVESGPGTSDAAPVDAATLPVFTPLPHAGDRVASDLPPGGFLVEVPWDIQAIVEADPATAARWRDATRAHFERALGGGYAVHSFRRDTAASRGFYVFTRVSAGRAS